jgi:hypothetical protein
LLFEGKKMQRTDPGTRVRPHRSWAARKLACVLIFAHLFGPVSSLPVLAQPPRPSEYDVKAAYLINFGKFVRFSESQPPRSSFDICVLGRDSMGSTLEALASNQTIESHPIRIRHIPDIVEAKSCRILFISPFEGDRIHEDLAILSDSSILTVSDASDFLERGGMIQFVLIQNHVRFAINLDAVNRAHLVLSSELLRVASFVTGKPPTGGLP